MLVQIDRFLEYEATSANFFYLKYLEYVSETLWDYCLDVWLSVCKRSSLDDQYLLVIFIVKVGEKQGI